MADFVRAEICRDMRKIQLKTARIRREKHLATRRNETRDGAQEIGIVAVDGETVCLHALGVGECRRIAHHDVVELAASRPGLEPLQTIGVNRSVIGVHLEVVQREVALVPIEVGLRHVERGCLGGTARARVHAERASVRKQVEHALARRALLDGKAGGTVIEEQTDIEVVGEVDLETQTMLVNDPSACARINAFILIAAALFRTLATTLLDEQSIAGDAQTSENLRLGGGAILTVALESVVLGAMKKPRDRVAPAFTCGRAIPVHDHREIGNVFLIETKAGDSLLSRPFRDMAHAVVEAIGEHGSVDQLHAMTVGSSNPLRYSRVTMVLVASSWLVKASFDLSQSSSVCGKRAALAQRSPASAIRTE